MHTRNTSRALHHIAVELSIVLAERTDSWQKVWAVNNSDVGGAGNFDIDKNFINYYDTYYAVVVPGM